MVPAAAFVGCTPLVSRRTRSFSACSPRPSPRMAPRRTVYMRSGPRAPPQERLLSILPYAIPLLDSLSFGKFVFQKIPLLANLLLAPLYPVYKIYRGIPFLAFGVFLALYVLVVRNSQISRYIRFNVYQALILDIALILPQLFQGFNLGVPTSVVEIFTTAVFYASTLAIGYAVVCNVRGQIPDEIPAISESVYQQMGPF